MSNRLQSWPEFYRLRAAVPAACRYFSFPVGVCWCVLPSPWCRRLKRSDSRESCQRSGSGDSRRSGAPELNVGDMWFFFYFFKKKKKTNEMWWSLAVQPQLNLSGFIVYTPKETCDCDSSHADMWHTRCRLGALISFVPKSEIFSFSMAPPAAAASIWNLFPASAVKLLVPALWSNNWWIEF